MVVPTPFGAVLTVVVLTFASTSTPTQAQTLRERASQLLGEGRVLEAGLLLHNEAEQETDPAAMAAAHNNACVLLARAGRAVLALDDCALAVAQRRELQDRVGLGRSLNNQALALQRLGRLDDAAAAFGEALVVNQEIGELESAVINQLNLGAVYSYRGDYDGALRLYRAAEADALAAQAEWTGRQVLIALQNQGSALERLEAHEQALSLYLELLSEVEPSKEGGRQSIGADTPQLVSSFALANLQHNVGVVYRNLGDAVEAEVRLRRAIDLFAEIDDLAGESSAWLNLGLLLDLDYRDHGAATVALRRAAELARQAGDTHEELQVLSHLVQVLIDADALDEAEDALARTNALSRRSDGLEAEWRVSVGKARLALARGELVMASELALSAVSEVDALSQAMSETLDLARFVEAREGATALAVDLLLRRAETAVEQPSAPQGQGSAELRQRAFEIALRSKERALVELGAEGVPQRGNENRLFDFDRIRNALGDAVLVELVVVGDELVRFHLTASQFGHERIGQVQDFDAAARRIRRAVLGGSSNGASATLARADLEQLARLLRGVDLGERLFVGGSGALNFLPWDLLPVPGDAQGADAGGPNELLVDRTALALLPSAAALLSTPEAKREPDDQSVIAAPARRWLAVSVPESKFEIEADVPHAALDSLLPLRFAEAEAQMVAQTLGGTGALLEGGEATTGGLLNLLAQSATQVVHIAAHTVMDESPGGGAAMLLANGPLSAKELQSTQLDVGLAVLAACSTQSDNAGTGRMLTTITGAWLQAGARAVLATLWDVNDASAFAMMEQFYFELALGKDPQRALADAKRRLRSDPLWEGSQEWAAFVLVGDGRALIIEQRRSLGVVGWIAIVALLVMIALRLQKRPRAST